MPNTRVRDAASRAVNLIPFQTDTYPLRGLTGNYAAVCTPVQTVPAELRSAHLERHDAYMNGKGRMTPDHGPRYYVTSGGQLIAWVTLDGRTHFTADVVQTETSVELAGLTPTQRRHREMIRAAWPTRFTLTSD